MQYHQQNAREELIGRGFVSEFIKGPEADQFGQNLMISGDKTKMEVDVATNMGIKTSVQEFLILEHDTEPWVMGVQWH